MPRAASKAIAELLSGIAEIDPSNHRRVDPLRLSAMAAKSWLLYGHLWWMLGLALLPTWVQAHLMPSQRGTLNFVEGGVYMALSLPASAFPYAADVQQAGSGAAAGTVQMSAAAYTRHLARLTADVEKNVQLLDDQGPLTLEGTLLNFSPNDHNDPNGAASQLVVLGRFNLRHPRDVSTHGLRWRIALYGQGPLEQRITATVTRLDSVNGQKQQQWLSFGPDDPERLVFPSAWATFYEHVRLGILHILEGFDHLLFLLAVLASLSGWRTIFLVLTGFTLGHAVTLSLSLVSGVSLPSQPVESGIALTIVAVALHDLWSSRSGRHLSNAYRLSLVFVCALVHGLGLAFALKDRGLDRDHLWATLAGFNVGVEVGQIAAGALFVAGLWTVRRCFGPKVEACARQLALFIALMAGCFWFTERVWA